MHLASQIVPFSHHFSLVEEVKAEVTERGQIDGKKLQPAKVVWQQLSESQRALLLRCQPVPRRATAPLPALRQRLNNGKKLLSSHVETVGDGAHSGAVHCA